MQQPPRPVLRPRNGSCSRPWSPQRWCVSSVLLTLPSNSTLMSLAADDIFHVLLTKMVAAQARRDSQDEPFAWASREFLRKKAIGQVSVLMITAWTIDALMCPDGAQRSHFERRMTNCLPCSHARSGWTTHSLQRLAWSSGPSSLAARTWLLPWLRQGGPRCWSRVDHDAPIVARCWSCYKGADQAVASSAGPVWRRAAEPVP